MVHIEYDFSYKPSEWDYTYMAIAESMAMHSKCAAKKVGCIVVRNTSIVSSGVNGTPHGTMNCNEIFKKNDDGSWETIHERGLDYSSHKDFSLKNEIHAEINALSKMTRNGISSENCIMYCTWSPCSDCAKAIIASGISRLFYKNKFDDYHSLGLLEQAGIELYKLD